MGKRLRMLAEWLKELNQGRKPGSKIDEGIPADGDV